VERIPEAVDLLKAEEEVRSKWKKEQLLERLKDSRRGKPRFRFLEGPPTVNGYMHVGHARGRTIKDVYLRWRGMQGFDVWRQAGWDCQGLPVELEVEKNLKLTSKKDIEEKVGVEKFVSLCKELVDSYLAHWRSTSERLGLSLDYDSAYETRRDAYVEVGWRTLKRANERGMLVEDFKVIPFCPRCETPLSGHEVALGYDKATDPSIYVKFQLEGKKGHYALIWTTTPWTLLANEAIAVHPDVMYAFVRVGEERWLVARPLVERVMTALGVTEYEVNHELKGSKIVGLRYEHPFADEVTEHKKHKGRNDHSILPAEYVTLDEGTGCVHTAPGHGPDDFQLGKKYDLPIFSPVGQNGRYTFEAGPYVGKHVKEADEGIIEDLRKKGLLAFAGKIEHTYPFCWRCDTPLLYRADLQWFLRADPIRKQMVEENLKIKWRPEWAGRNRFHEWLQNAGDWCISRTRYWGTPLNVWTCGNCGARVVIGSKKELEAKADSLPARFELHRPWVDRVELKCEKCGGTMKREPPVLDAWFDSGVAHTASLAHLAKKPDFDDLFPYQFITEAVDQFRGWYYSLLFTGILLYGVSPYQSVLCQEHILDEEGRKMSKSKGNTIWARETMDKVGSDPLRLHLLTISAPWDTVPYRAEGLELNQRRLRILFNIFSFATTYMSLDNYSPSHDALSRSEKSLTVEDRWILSRIQSTIAEITEQLENRRPDEAIKTLLNFAVDDVSREYLRSVKRRVWLEEESPEKLAAYDTLYYILERLLRSLAPFAPHLSEWLYLRIVQPENPTSIHLTDWPISDKKWLDPKLEEEMQILHELAATTANARQKAKLKLRWPVSRIIVMPLSDETYKAAKTHTELLATAVNTRSVEVLKPGERNPDTVLTAKPNLKSLGSKHRKKLDQVLQAISRESAEKLRDQLHEKGAISLQLTGEKGAKVEISKEDLSFEEGYPAYYSKAESKIGGVLVDIRRDRDLESSALARELVRRAQSMRKEMGLRVEEYVEVEITFDDDDDLRLVADRKDYLSKEIRAEQLNLTSTAKTKQSSKWGLTRDWEIDGQKIIIKMKRIVKEAPRKSVAE
jgi:isoleucyl-tRNA synthetase